MFPDVFFQPKTTLNRERKTNLIARFSDFEIILKQTNLLLLLEMFQGPEKAYHSHGGISRAQIKENSGWAEYSPPGQRAFQGPGKGQ